MAVLESSMEDQKSEKQSPNTKKSILLLAQDLSYARNLAANNEKVRRRSLKYLKKYLEQRSKASPLTEDSLKVIWKGLFYSMWMSDKPLVQEDCAESISQLIHCLQFDEAMQFFKIGLVTLQNEWNGIDQLRLNKFLMFVRRLLRQALFVLRKMNFKKIANRAFANILEETILTTTTSVPLGLFMHFTEIYLEELAKVSDGNLRSSRTIDFLRPYIYKLAFADDNRITQWINKFIFTHLMKQHKSGIEYEEKYKIWKEHGFVGSINQIQKVYVSDTGAEDQQSEKPSENKALDPRAGKVDVELPPIVFDAKEIAETLLLPKNDSRTSKKTRNHLTIWSEQFLKLHNGIFPLGVKKLESKKRKNLDNIDTNVRRAAKRLIKFEQKLLLTGENKKNKRKREHMESHDEDLILNLKNNKKARIEENPNKHENSRGEEKPKKDKTKKPKTYELSPNLELDELNSVSKKNKVKELKKTVLKDKLKKKKLKIKEPANDINSSIDNYNFCFERNSGVWYVTPMFGENNDESAKQSPAANRATDTSDGEYEICIPSKKFVRKLKKANSDEKVGQILNRLRGKSRTSLSNLNRKLSVDELTTPRKHQLKTGSPKKVVINTKLNVSQDIDDHILQVLSSPQPWDSSKKPGKPLLKTPIKASPINPFYKLKRF